MMAQWPSRHYVHDGSWEGLLCVVFTVFAEKHQACSVVRDRAHVADLFVPVREVVTDEAQAMRVSTALEERLGADRLRRLWTVHLAERQDADEVLVAYLVRTFTMRPQEVDDAREPVVLRLRDWRQKVRHEAHHMEAFVRFQETVEGGWTATVAPAYNVLPLIAPHFRKRYADMRWTIVDERRGYGIHFDGRVLSIVVPPEEGALPASPEEAAYRTLWRTYFTHVDIPERRNRKLQLQRMPKRFWKHVLEMQGR